MGKKGQAAATDRHRSLTSFPLQFLIGLALVPPLARAAAPGSELSLDGTWDCGLERHYDHTTVVPGLSGDPAAPSAAPLWFRRVVELPAGSWSTAVLHLRGAQWSPAVFVGGQPAAITAEQDGGWSFVLPPAATPGNIVLIEIALQPDPHPPADPASWDISSDLWDGVYLHFSAKGRLTGLAARSDWAARACAITWSAGDCPAAATVTAEIWDGDHRVGEMPPAAASAGAARFALPDECRLWTPASPKLYTLRVALRSPDGLLDQVERPWARRQLHAVGGHYEMNGQRLDLRGVQVAWHHWLCDPESARLAFDPEWFKRHILDAVKSYGGNFVYFTDGPPPAPILALCEREGILAETRPIPDAVADFGAIFLDGEGRPSESRTVRAEIIRFLGPQQSSAERLAFQAYRCALAAEAARLQGAGVIAPLCALSSPLDRYHGFIGAVAEGRRKPVWDALSASLAPVTAVLDFTDVDFLPGATLPVPVVFLNSSQWPAQLTATVALRSAGDGTLAAEQIVHVLVPAQGRVTKSVALTLPAAVDHWILSSSLPPAITAGAPRISYRRVRTIAPKLPPALADRAVGVPADATELRALAVRNGLTVVDPGDPSAKLVILDRRAWEEEAAGGEAEAARWKQLLASGRSIVWLDVGLPAKSSGRARIALPSGVTASLTAAAEAERNLQPAGAGSALWYGLTPDSCWGWNGADGAVVPPETMDVAGLSGYGFLKVWESRGAEQSQIRFGPCYAYGLQGLYAFSNLPHDAEAIQGLHDRLRRIAHDKPVLNSYLDFDAPIVETDLYTGFHDALKAGASSIAALASAGADLARTPVVEIGYAPGKGVLVLSQLKMAGRLTPAAPHYDPAAEQMVLNLLGVALDDYSPVAP